MKVSSEQGKWTWNATQTTAGWIERGLQARPITRDLKWGIPVPKPGYEDKVFYVWFDAPIGYISITAKAFENWEDWWLRPDDVDLYQFMAKDNIPFHTVIFPASLLGSGRDWTTLHHINSTEYLNYEDTKFSKSRNIGVFGTDVKETGIPTDLWRFYLLLVRPEANDSAFVWEKFYERVNADFIDNIANLVNRTLTFMNKNFEGRYISDFSGEHKEAITGFQQECEAITASLEAVKLRDSLRLLLALGNSGNKFFQDMTPWHKIKEDRDHAHATVSVLAYLIRTLAIGLEPYMPDTSKRIFEYLNIDQPNWDQFGSFEGLDGHQIGKPEILYRKLDMKEAEKFRKKFSGDQPKKGIFHLKAAQITEVEKHPNSDHLYKLTVDAGESEKRTIAAGLVKHYSEEELLNKKVVILANLKEADIRGVMSQGMALVCEKRKKMELLDGAPFETGSLIDGDLIEGEINVDQFKGAPFSVVDGKVMFDDEVCTIGSVPIGVNKLQNGKVK